MKITPPAIGFSYSEGMLARFIAYFTGSQWSHSFLMALPVYDLEMCQEAGDMNVQTVSFNKHYRKDPKTSYELYVIKGIKPHELESALEAISEDFSGVRYGYLQLLWFIWRWINKKFGKDISNQKNWLSSGVICSELCFWFLVYCGLGHLVKNFNGDTIQAQDLYEIIKNNPDIFELLEHKRQGEIL